jgi:hypothetical protein
VEEEEEEDDDEKEKEAEAGRVRGGNDDNDDDNADDEGEDDDDGGARVEGLVATSTTARVLGWRGGAAMSASALSWKERTTQAEGRSKGEQPSGTPQGDDEDDNDVGGSSPPFLFANSGIAGAENPRALDAENDEDDDGDDEGDDADNGDDGMLPLSTDPVRPPVLLPPGRELLLLRREGGIWSSLLIDHFCLLLACLLLL